ATPYARSSELLRDALKPKPSPLAAQLLRQQQEPDDDAHIAYLGAGAGWPREPHHHRMPLNPSGSVSDSGISPPSPSGSLTYRYTSTRRSSASAMRFSAAAAGFSTAT